MFTDARNQSRDMLTPNEIFGALQVAVVAYVFTIVLMKPDFIFEWYSDLLDDLERCGGWRKWIAKPLGNCELCFAGQFGLWSYFGVFNATYRERWTTDIFALIIFISFCIFFTQIITISIEKFKKQ